MDDLLSLLRSGADLAEPAARAALERLGPGLTIGGDTRIERPALHEDAAEASWLVKEGFALLPNALPAASCARFCESIERLTAAGLPATFVYLFDEPWHLGEEIRSRVSAMLGRRYEIVEDFWAWRIPPGEGRGWPPHRGLTEPRLDRDAPELINTWIALSDVEAERACLHVVPLDDDPGYPNALSRLEAPLGSVRAVPLVAGSALVWNANLLHWGGTCSPRARGPRVSASFSLVRADTRAAPSVPLVAEATSKLGARVDAIARQLVTYGDGQPDVSRAVRAWAEASVMLNALVAKTLAHRADALD